MVKGIPNEPIKSNTIIPDGVVGNKRKPENSLEELEQVIKKTKLDTYTKPLLLNFTKDTLSKYM